MGKGNGTVCAFSLSKQEAEFIRDTATMRGCSQSLVVHDALDLLQAEMHRALLAIEEEEAAAKKIAKKAAKPGAMSAPARRQAAAAEAPVEF